MTDVYQRGFDAGVAAERTRLSAGVEMTDAEIEQLWRAQPRVDGASFWENTARPFARALIAEASARATAAERERCARWHDEAAIRGDDGAAHALKEGDVDGSLLISGTAETHRRSAAAHRAGEGK